MTTELNTVTPDDAVIELFSPPQPADPFPLYDVLMETNRVYRSPSLGLWAVTGYAESAAILRANTTRNGPRAASTMRPDWAEHEALRMYLNALITLDPPDHSRVRGLAGRVFTPAAVRALGPSIERLMRRHLDDMVELAHGGAPVDLITSLASPFPVAVISEMLGVPDQDGMHFYHVANNWSRVWAGGYYSEEDLTRADAAALELREYFDGILDERRRSPREDLLSTLVREGDNARLSPEETMSLATFLFVAGFETTTSLISAGLISLLDHPDQLELWRRDASVTPTAVEELLRFNTPITAASRVMKEDTALGDQIVPAGNLVVALLAAANRDPRQFTDPGRLDLTRSEGANLAFSAGPHFCMGGNLARLEASVLFPAFLERFSRIEVVGAPTRRDAIGLNGYEELQVVLA
ncbi:cytochrome P450 [Streptomyces sp. NBC_00704]|uniref:cytochrome P450 n=1 Tax=Streptomyces sp. NBC_00704 TaxID=2975809 RepID=UPI002E33AFA8|nr:cytochrome P450 [Streptomyces sp. NBC_00704]